MGHYLSTGRLKCAGVLSHESINLTFACVLVGVRPAWAKTSSSLTEDHEIVTLECDFSQGGA